MMEPLALILIVISAITLLSCCCCLSCCIHACIWRNKEGKKMDEFSEIVSLLTYRLVGCLYFIKMSHVLTLSVGDLRSTPVLPVPGQAGQTIVAPVPVPGPRRQWVSDSVTL